MPESDGVREDDGRRPPAPFGWSWTLSKASVKKGGIHDTRGSSRTTNIDSESISRSDDVI
jgi:hypothetical protein